MPNLIFERVEKKYLLDSPTYEELMRRLAPHIRPDEYGLETICNVYFDTPDHELIRQSIEKPKYKEKLRLRSYGTPKGGDTVFLELKKKYKGIVYKRRVKLTLDEAERYLLEGVRPEKDSQVLRELDYFLAFYRPEPMLYLAYDREAFIGVEDDRLRVTFDTGIRSRTTELSLGAGDHGEYLLEPGLHLMEIKVPGVFPLWLARILSELGIYPISFSKYGNIYKKSIISERGVC